MESLLIKSYKRIKQTSVGEFKDKGSKFLAFAHFVESEDHVKEIIKSYKKEYFDARHYCYAYVLGKEVSISKIFDDGEPTYSAGSPILGQIKSFDLTNTLVVVVRYFGGIKLGVSGLINAYKSATKEALLNAEIYEVKVSVSYLITFHYEDTSLVERVIQDAVLRVVDRVYADRCVFSVEVALEYQSQMLALLSSYEAKDIDIQLLT